LKAPYPQWSKAMSDGRAHKGSCLDDKALSDSVGTRRWPNSAVVLEALAALEAEFSSILNPGTPASE
jgi:hypothetical protein